MKTLNAVRIFSGRIGEEDLLFGWKKNLPTIRVCRTMPLARLSLRIPFSALTMSIRDSVSTATMAFSS